MTTNIKEMSYSELKANMNDINVQVEELQAHMENLRAETQKYIAEIEDRKKHVVENYRQHMSQILEDTRIMLEMGIDPNTVAIPSAIEEEGKSTIPTCEEAEVSTCEATKVPSYELEASEEVQEEDITTVPELDTPILTSEEKKEVGSGTKKVKEDKVKTKEKGKNPLLTPSHYLLGLCKGIYSSGCDRDQHTNQVSKPLLPAEQLLSDHIYHRLNMGNVKHRDSYPNPDEGRIFSTDGIAPTITATHSDLHIWVTNREDKLAA